MLLVISVAVGVSAQHQRQYETKKDGDYGRDGSIIEGTLGALQTEGLIRTEQVDPAKTWIIQLASQKLSKRKSRQLYLVEFFLRSGQKVEAIARRDQSPIVEESGLVVYVVSKILQPDGVPVPPRQ